jgi:TetR/AcrR family transcriptional regulator
MEPVEPSTQTRDAILAAAATLFAERGQTGTTIKDIGRAAGVNPALIYYYFEDKAGLYDAVLAEQMGRFPERLVEAIDPGHGPREALAAVVRRQAQVFIAEPQLPRLIVRELADHFGDRATPLLGEHARRLLATITGLIRRGQEEGIFRRDVEPHHAAISCLSQLNWYCISSPLMRILLHNDPSPDKPLDVERFAEHVVSFTLAALEAR